MGMYIAKSLPLLGMGLLALAGNSYGQAPAKKDVKIYGFIAGGTGCPGDGASSTRIVTNSNPGSQGADYFQVVYDAFIVKFGPGASRRDRTKNCNFTFNVDYPKGYKFRFQSLQFEGYAELAEGVNGRFDSEIRAPFGEDIGFRTFLIGPYDGDYGEAQTKQKLMTFETDCGGTAMLKVNTTIRLRGNKKRQGLLTVDAATGLLTQAYKVNWVRCEEWEM